MKTNEDGFREVNGDFIATDSHLSCDSQWRESVHSSFDSYVKSRLKSISTGNGIEFGTNIVVRLGKLPIFVKLPTLLTRSSLSDSSIKNLKQFLNDKNGTVIISEATCTTHEINISLGSKNKAFTKTFLDKLITLQNAADLPEKERILEFAKFVDEYGTHFSTKTHMGVKLYSERRYHSRKTEKVSRKALVECNTLKAVKTFKVPLDSTRKSCVVDKFVDDDFNEKDLEREIVTSFGSFASDSSVTNWAETLIGIENKGRLRPRAIRRELKMILHLFEAGNFPNNLVHNNVSIQPGKILGWLTPAMANYCENFNSLCAAGELSEVCSGKCII